jgi:IS66 Orf2 like protein
MIVPSGAVRVLVATRPVDFRKGMDGLAALVRESLGSDPYSGVIYVFRVIPSPPIPMHCVRCSWPSGRTMPKSSSG